MRYIAYLLFILSIILGYFAVYPMVVLPLALVTSLIFISARRTWLKSNPQATPVNPLIDGVYLLFLHLLMLSASEYSAVSPLGSVLLAP